MTTRLPLMVGQLNDGIEAQFSGTQVPDVMEHAHVGLFDELDRNLATQLPDCRTAQGSDADRHTLGIAIGTDLLGVLEGQTFWTKLNGTRTSWALTMRVEYSGTELSLITTKRPGKMHSPVWPDFDTSLAALVAAERGAGRIVIVGLDANSANDLALQARTRLTWVAPYPTSMVGLLVSSNVQVVGCEPLPSTGEHTPVLAWLRIPTTA